MLRLSYFTAFFKWAASNHYRIGFVNNLLDEQSRFRQPMIDVYTVKSLCTPSSYEQNYMWHYEMQRWLSEPVAYLKDNRRPDA
jgi:hypothetical protein